MCSRAQPSGSKEGWVNGSIGYPTRQKPTAQRDEGTQGTMRRSGWEGEKEAISARSIRRESHEGSTGYKVHSTNR